MTLLTFQLRIVWKIEIDEALIKAPADGNNHSDATIVYTTKEFLTDKLRNIIIDVIGHKDLIKYMIDVKTQTHTGLTMVSAERWTIFNLRILFETDKIHSFPCMGERQNTQITKQKQIEENKKHANRSQQQLTLQAHELDDIKLNGGMDEKLDEGKYNDLTDGRYKKTIYVKTWIGKTITVEIGSKRTVDTIKRQTLVKIKIPKDHQYLACRGKALMDKKNVEGLQRSGRRDYRNDSVVTWRNKKQVSAQRQ